MTDNSKKANKLTNIIGFSLLSASALILGTQAVSMLLAPKIETRERLEQVISEEKKRLSCTREIKAILVEHTDGRAIKGRDAYYVQLGGIFANESTARHEIYHICAGHLDDGDYVDNFWKIPQYEIAAIMYEAFGIKL